LAKQQQRQQRSNRAGKPSLVARAARAAAVPDGGGGASADGVSDRTLGITALLLGIFITVFLLWKNHKPPGMGFYEYNLVNLAMVFWLPLTVTMLFLRREPAEVGMVVGDAKKGTLVALILFALFVPVLIFVAPMQGPQDYYTRWFLNSGLLRGVSWDGRTYTGGYLHWESLIAHEVVMAFYMFGWEWYHRGFLLNGMKRIMPVWAAVGVQALFFMALHLKKPGLEMLSSLPGGIFMGWLALRYRSFLPCFVLHFLVSAGFDAAVLYYRFR
jgi:CAAX amino terminal protease family.